MSASSLSRFILDHSVTSGVLIALALGIVFQFLPNYWQLIIFAGLVPGLIVKSLPRGFVSGFLGVLFSWIVYVAYLWIVSPVAQVISTLGDIVGLPGPLLVGLAVLVASLFGGLGGAIGVTLRRLGERHQ